MQEFCELVLDVRRHEADQQVEAIREGFLQVIQNKEDILDFCDWETMESRCTGEKTVSIERLKSITSYPNCSADHEIVGRFWRVFETFSDEESAKYLKF